VLLIGPQNGYLAGKNKFYKQQSLTFGEQHINCSNVTPEREAAEEKPKVIVNRKQK